MLKEKNKKQISPTNRQLIKQYANMSKKLGNKSESIQKVEVFLSSQESNDIRSKFMTTHSK